MDIRVVESIMTSGALADPTFRVDSSIENVSLDWNEADGKLSVVDYNMNYNILPWQLYGQLVKKVFLTYNGMDCPRRQLVETVVMESNNAGDINQIPGYNNSNQWEYQPSTFTYPSEILNFTDPQDFIDQPYQQGPGFTVVKTFLTSQANVSPNLGSYTAFYHAPTYTNFVLPNVLNKKIYTDGWYTSYVCAVRTWSSVDPVMNGSSAGNIVFYEPNNKFYINLTGQGGSLVTTTGAVIPTPDTVNWRVDPTFAEWQTLMRNNVGVADVNDPIYFIETQHLVTVDLNKAIFTELKKICNCCSDPKFDTSHMETYQKLYGKRLGAWIQFNQELFHLASCIVIGARPLCYACLYHNESLHTSGPKSC